MVRKRVHVRFSMLLVLLVLGGVAFYIHRTYFFNPILFRNTNVIYLPWKWYKNPLQVEVWGANMDDTNKTYEYSTTDPHTVRFVIGELEKGKITSQPSWTGQGKPNPIIHIILRSGPSKDSPILQDAVIVGENASIAAIGTEQAHYGFEQYIELTPSLLDFIHKNIGPGHG